MRDEGEQALGDKRPRRGRRVGAKWIVVLTLILGGGAALGAGVSAQGVDACDTAGSGVCAPAQTEQTPTTTEQEPPPAPDPPSKPAAPAPAQPAPQKVAPAPTPCADGTLPPCVAVPQSDPSQGTAKRKLDCRKRPGRRRPKRCPRLKGKTRTKHEEQRARQKRRTAARERVERERRRAENKKQCEDDAVTLFGQTPEECKKAADRGGIIVGRYLSRPLPDALPPGSRLSAQFAKLLKQTVGSRWPVVLAVLRAEGKSGPDPAGAEELKKLAKRVHGEGGLEERVQALADYHRAVGLAGLTSGLDAIGGELIDRVLRDARVSIYGAGRTDVAGGRIDARVLVTMLYLAERQGGILVTSLVRGHGLLTKSGNVSLHASGRAMDIAAVGGTSILGNQQPGGVTDAALRNIMLMPAEFRPNELISLFAIGGPSFAMADHADHIHVGY
jgi:hypothetical protein